MAGRYIADQNKVLGIHESGTYGAEMAGSSFWIGQVTDHSITHNEGVMINRYLGTADRNIDTFDVGPIDVTGTITYHPQDMRVMFYTIGSVVDTSGTNASHVVSEINSNVTQTAYTSGTGVLNAPFSFTIEDSKQAPGTGRNFIRTIRGIVPNTTTLTLSQGERATITVDYLGQSILHSSGTTTSLTEDTTRSFLWSDTTLTLAGSVITTAKSIDLEVNQNREAPHYINGSRVVAAPFNGNRDYTLSVTMDLNSTEADMFYKQYYIGGSQFNSTLDLNADSTTGSKHAVFIMSGCRIMNMENPTALEGATESTIEIRPTSINGVAWDKVAGGRYNPW